MKGSNLSYDDPFESAPADEPATEPENTSAAAEKPAVATSEGKISLTFKGAGQFSDRWLVVYVATPTEGLDLLRDPDFKELLDYSRKIGKYDSDQSGGGSAPAAGGGQQRPQRAPQGATEPPAWMPPKPYDDFVYKTGVTKSGRNQGKVWHAWMPPEKNDPQGREAVFHNPPQ